MNDGRESKSEIRARIKELNSILELESIYDIRENIISRIVELTKLQAQAEEDISTMIDLSHDAVCAAKQMDEDEAYGQDPAAYYTLALCGESGELANEIVKSLRNGYDEELVDKAIRSELPDIIIYSYILAKVKKLPLSEMVRKKVDIVIQRARSGYYGEPINRSHNMVAFRTKENIDIVSNKKYLISVLSKDGTEIDRLKCRIFPVMETATKPVQHTLVLYDIPKNKKSLLSSYNYEWEIHVDEGKGVRAWPH